MNPNKLLFKKYGKLSCILLGGTTFVILSLLGCAVWINKMFGGSSVLEFVYHLNMGIQGADNRYWQSAVKYIALAAVVAVVFMAYLSGMFYAVFFRLAEMNRCKGKIHKAFHCAAKLVSPPSWKFTVPCVVIAGVAVVFWVDRQLKVTPYIAGALEHSKVFDENYVFPRFSEIKFPEKKRNLVYIMAESLEDDLNKSPFFEPVMPELLKLQQENISFRGHQQVHGTNWTAGGMVAMFMGFPMHVPLSQSNRFGTQKHFLPGAPSILGLLDQNGYNMAFLLGSDVKFAGKDKLFAHSKSIKIKDLQYFFDNGSAKKENMNSWGLCDYALFDLAREEISALAAENKPFSLFLLTLDTHESDIKGNGFVSKYGDIRDAFYNQNLQIKQFCDWLKTQPFYSDTTIVIVGDHLAMVSLNSLADYARGHRETYNCIVNSAIPKQSNDRLYGTFDFAPTVLEALGCQLPDRRFGLGVSLFSNQPTLFEKVGLKTYLSEMNKQSRIFNSFFAEPGDR